jgi:hypothetical protein
VRRRPTIRAWRLAWAVLRGGALHLQVNRGDECRNFLAIEVDE